jgi:hypothetical protein
MSFNRWTASLLIVPEALMIEPAETESLAAGGQGAEGDCGTGPSIAKVIVQVHGSAILFNGLHFCQLSKADAQEAGYEAG